MSDDDDAQVMEDPPAPNLADLEQREVVYPAVPVQVEGTVLIQQQPNRTGFATNESLTTAPPMMVLGADPRRAVAHLIGSAAWLYRASQSGMPVTVPANTILTITHSGAVWAASVTGSVTLGVIGENYAQ